MNERAQKITSGLPPDLDALPRLNGLEDGVSIFISWAMIVTMLIYIYPLKAIFSSMWFLLSGGRRSCTWRAF